MPKGMNDALLGAFDDEEEEDEWKEDPLFKSDIVELLKNELRSMSRSDPAYFTSILTELSEKEIAYMNSLFSQTPSQT